MIRQSRSRRPAYGAASRFSILVSLCLACHVEAAVVASDTSAIEIPMKETSVFEVPQQFRSRFLRGQTTICDQARNGSVTYPADMHAKALFGSMHLPNAQSAAGNRRGICFAFDTTDSTYDRLYFDSDGDLDLTDETPIAPRKDVPAGALLGYANTEQETCFSDVEVTFDFGPGGKQAVKLMPRLIVRQGTAQVSFLAPTVRQGDFQIGNVTCQAYLGYMYSITGRLDQPNTALILVRDGTPQLWSGGYNLTATHEIDGRFFRFTSTPTGDKLTAQPYDGPLGTFELGAGSRDVQTLTMSGSLRSKEGTVAVAYPAGRSNPKPTGKVQLPVGDYYPVLLTVTLDQFQTTISNNYYQDSLGRSRGEREPVHGFKIREDKPFVLDFSAKPMVVFTQPEANARVKLGQTLQVQAVMIDPDLDVMIRRLYDTSSGRSVSLEPKVVVTRASGEIVAQGVMPFG